MIDRFNPTNWLGKGVLVDFSDIIPHHTGYRWWRPAYYAQQGPGFCRIPAERALEQGLLGPRPKWEPIQTGLRQRQRASFLPAPSKRARRDEVIPVQSPATEKAPAVSGDQPIDGEAEVDAEEGSGAQESKGYEAVLRRGCPSALHAAPVLPLENPFPSRDPALGLSRQQRPLVRSAATSSIR
jgi:hypothetical protein